jgi:hypothetical protein
MLTDRLTTRVLGLLFLFLPFLIDASALIFTRPEARTVRMAVVIIGPSLPLFLIGLWLLRKAARMKEDADS